MAESTRQREAFQAYWALGAHRSIERLQAVLASTAGGPSLRTLYGWSSRYHWQLRIAELERQAQASDQAARLQALHDMAERQAQEALLLQQRATERLLTIDPQDFSATSAIRALVEGAKLERLVRGAVPLEGSAPTGRDVQLEAVSDAELYALLGYPTPTLDGGESP